MNITELDLHGDIMLGYLKSSSIINLYGFYSFGIDFVHMSEGTTWGFINDSKDDILLSVMGFGAGFNFKLVRNFRIFAEGKADLNISFADFGVKRYLVKAGLMYVL